MHNEIIKAVKAKGAKPRLLGGRAVALLCGGAVPKQLQRESLDIDIFIVRADRKSTTQALKEFGCAAETEFNLLNGNERLMFHYEDVKIDIFVDRFRMSHTLDLRRRIDESEITLSPADLLLTKLQVAEINLKDLIDIAALLLALPFDPDDRLGIDAPYLARCLANDWGLWRTSTFNLTKTKEAAREFLPKDGPWLERLTRVLEALEAEIASAPKSVAWRARSLLGERLAWFEKPEEPEVRRGAIGEGSTAR